MFSAVLEPKRDQKAFSRPAIVPVPFPKPVVVQKKAETQQMGRRDEDNKTLCLHLSEGKQQTIQFLPTSQNSCLMSLYIRYEGLCASNMNIFSRPQMHLLFHAFILFSLQSLSPWNSLQLFT